ncbi:MAG TPA: hypothetical protein VJ998_02405, partial [Pseudomonadales bacterium]|nr:hypothetical protein [Pseudomonadales bacterium]
HLWLPFPTCWCVNRFEPGLSARLLDIYRVELGNTMPAALDDKLFGTGLMAATVAGLTRNSRINVFETDDTWGISTQRQRWQVRIQVVRETAALSGFPAIAASADQFIDKISQEWRALEPMPLYPAFR